MSQVTDEQLVQSLCDWLLQARAVGERLGGDSRPGDGAESVAEGVADSRNGVPQASEPPIGLMRLVEEFTALRHEVKLQQRGARGLEENTAKQAEALRQAIEAMRSIEPREQAAVWRAGKGLALALADIDEALARGRRQLEKTIETLLAEQEHEQEHEQQNDEAMEPLSPAAPSHSYAEARERIETAYRSLPAWKRWFSRDLYRSALEAIPEFEFPPAGSNNDSNNDSDSEYETNDANDNDEADEADSASDESLAQLTALRDGFAMMHARLGRALAAEGLQRIPTEGELVDPELMLVLETIEADAPAGMVLEEIRPGYLWNGKLLRTAEVRAAASRDW